MFVSACVYETKSLFYPNENSSSEELVVSSMDVQLVAACTSYMKLPKGRLNTGAYHIWQTALRGCCGPCIVVHFFIFPKFYIWQR
jgi:hypothetical protein